MPDVDITQVDGPHSPEKTIAAARLIADAVRYLNYATMPGRGGIRYAGDVDAVLGGLEAAASGLHQTLEQLRGCLSSDLGSERLRLDDGSDPAEAVEQSGLELVEASGAIGDFATALRWARRHTARMYLEEVGDEGARNRSGHPTQGPAEGHLDPMTPEAEDRDDG